MIHRKAAITRRLHQDRTEPANSCILAEIPRLIVSSLEQLQTMRTMASTD